MLIEIRSLLPVPPLDRQEGNTDYGKVAANNFQTRIMYRKYSDNQRVTLTTVVSSVAGITNAAGAVDATALILTDECTAVTFYNTSEHTCTPGHQVCWSTRLYSPP